MTLSGGQAGITVSSETHGPAPSLLPSTATLSQLDGSGAAGLGMAGSLGKVQLAIAQTSSLVIAGVGDGFVKAVLDTKAGSSLADQPGYQKAINLAGANNGAQMFVDLTAIRTAIEALAAKSSGIAAYDSDVKPYLIPIESIGPVGDCLERGVRRAHRSRPQIVNLTVNQSAGAVPAAPSQQEVEETGRWPFESGSPGWAPPSSRRTGWS